VTQRWAERHKPLGLQGQRGPGAYRKFPTCRLLQVGNRQKGFAGGEGLQHRGSGRSRANPDFQSAEGGLVPRPVVDPKAWSW